MKKIKIYNTLTRKKEEFKSIKEKEVKLYSCGPTVYNHAHIGNLRSYIFADFLKRILLLAGYKIKHVMNITDVDDKTIKNSVEQNMSLKDFTRKYEEQFIYDLKSLFILPADHYPRATDYIEKIVQMIEEMLQQGYAYKANDGIYFKISSFDRYSELARIESENLKAGASERVSADEYDKENPNDFALWKFYNKEDGNVFWETSIGKGRPGWHIECSAMSTSILGKHIDIHTGGIDLIFPHHTNEIAQSESICETCRKGKDRFVNYWMHNEHLLVEGKKMAKRYNNFYTLKDIVSKGYSARAVRYVLISSHYRQQLNFTFESLDRAEREIQRISDLYLRLKEKENEKEERLTEEKETIDIEKYEKDFEEALYDDLNISRALFTVNEFMTETNKKINNLEKNEIKKCIQFIELTNSILEYVDDQYEQLTKDEESLIEKREKLRNEKKYTESDSIRKELSEKGIELRDTKEGTIWRKKTKSKK